MGKVKPDAADIFLQAFSHPYKGSFANMGQELLLPIKDLIDYDSFGKKLLRRYTLPTFDQWESHWITGREKWHSWG